MKTKTYQFRTFGPIFYSSIEGEMIKTDKFISSTALSYAIGYKLEDIEKYYCRIGERALNPDYSPLEELSYFVTDPDPLDVDTDERTFRSTSYTEETNIITEDNNVAGNLDTDYDYGFPKVMGKSQSGWHRLRHYSGISEGSTYRFTIFSEKEMPESLRFELGIKRTGYAVAHSVPNPDTVSLNEYLLNNVYDVDDDHMSQLIDSGARYYPASEPRVSRFSDVNINLAKKIVENNGLYKSRDKRS